MSEPTWWDIEDDDWTAEAIAEAWLFGDIEEGNWDDFWDE